MSVDEMTFYRFNLGAEIIKDVTFFSTKLKINNFFSITTILNTEFLKSSLKTIILKTLNFCVG
jgi:hypothetical protein